MKLSGEVNAGFVPEDNQKSVYSLYHPAIDKVNKDGIELQIVKSDSQENIISNEPESKTPHSKRGTWGSGMEFLMSCIAMSVGLGNIWRFPFTAYRNGGGAFLIPYIIVLVLVGKPLYFMEMILGQFSSKGTVKVYDFAPAMKGSGVGQTVAVMCVMTYYGSLMALIVYFLYSSFASVLPWSICDPEWLDCYPSGEDNVVISTNASSSATLFYQRTVINEAANIDDGIGVPSWRLAICLFVAYFTVCMILLKGVKSAGKASYFLALFPYVIMCVLLIRAVSLPGAMDGIIFFIKPNFTEILKPTVWYEAVTQCFFSLNVCFGNVIMYSSYNEFRHDIYRDTLIVTTMDTFTSLLAGFTIFGVLGNLAAETGRDIKNVVSGGTGLAFMSYPEAISKFKAVPQVFAVLFFLMLFVLGVGSNVAMASSITTVLRDKFPHMKHYQAVIGVCLLGFVIGLIYTTPGGQFLLNLVDRHGASFTVYILGIGQMLAITWIYGMRNFSDDIEFMLNRKVGIYWRLCWPIVTPLILIVILIYTLYELETIDYKGINYPDIAVVCGWLLSVAGIISLPLFACYTFIRRRSLGIPEMFKDAFRPSESWGPMDPQIKSEWIIFKTKKEEERQQTEKSKWREIYDYVLGY